MRRLIARLLRDDSGATAIEYGLICALIFLVIIGSVVAFGNAATTMFNTAITAIGDAVSKG
ncbi:Flp family type IVb pilin [Brevundimonas sp.]|uniref:Flp family type IVb pilin n=1 Tax=Brevundimonas sp. TaxID=1871086 RepID=UPI0025C6E1D2|nr:Flp family type IVb pilin [Brevundimonas sp.]